jgi:outer membrane protein assembly factor BamB
VFGAARGFAFALDSSTGKELWHLFLGGDSYAAPITYTIDGRQVVSIITGQSLFVFGL